MTEPTPYGESQDPAAASAPARGKLARTFYVYRMIRFGGFGLFGLLVAIIGPAAGAPWSVLVLGLLAVAVAGFGIWRTQVRWNQSSTGT